MFIFRIPRRALNIWKLNIPCNLFLVHPKVSETCLDFLCLLVLTGNPITNKVQNVDWISAIMIPKKTHHYYNNCQKHQLLNFSNAGNGHEYGNKKKNESSKIKWNTTITDDKIFSDDVGLDEAVPSGPRN